LVKKDINYDDATGVMQRTLNPYVTYYSYNASTNQIERYTHKIVFFWSQELDIDGDLTSILKPNTCILIDGGSVGPDEVFFPDPFVFN
jgi:hypothetical protein